MADSATEPVVEYESADESELEEPQEFQLPDDLPDLNTRIEWFEDWEEATRKSQQLARKDRSYYDGKQWSDEDLEILKERHQPPLVKNRIARKVNFILGEEIAKRVDPVARPREQTHEDGARAMTDALRYVEEQQKFDAARTAVAKDMLIEGYGGGIKEVEACDDGEGGTEYKFKLRHIQWDRLFYDPRSRELDFCDAKYKGAVVWMDLDDAIADYPDAEEALRAAILKDIGEAGGTTEDTPKRWVDKKRKRVKLVEMYFRHGKDWYRCIFTEGADVLEPERCFTLDEKGQYSVCPLIMASCYVDQDGMRYGIVRQLISPQDEINKRASKALHLLSVRQVIARKDAIPDPTKFQAELAKPDGYAEMAQHSKIGEDVQITQTGDLAQGHVAMMQQAIQDIDNIGPSAASIPELPSGASGVAFQRRQKAASQEMGSFFDSLRAFTLSVFELDYLCIRQYWTEEMWLRVTDDEELTGYRFVALNRQVSRAERMQELLQKGAPPPSALSTAAGTYTPIIMREVQLRQQQMAMQAQAMGQPPPQDPTPLILSHPLMQEVITENQVETMFMDIIVDEAPETSVLAQEEFQTLTELLPVVIQSRPDMAPSMAKLVVKASQLPNKRDLLKEMEKGPNPQEQQMKQQAEMLQKALAEANVKVTQTQAELNAARAAESQAKAQVTIPKAQAEIQVDRAKAEQAGAKVPSEIEKNQASAMKDAASAGERMAGGITPMGVL